MSEEDDAPEGARAREEDRGERVDVIETLRSFFARPFEAFSARAPEPAVEPDRGGEPQTQTALLDWWRRGMSVWAPAPARVGDDLLTGVGCWVELSALVPALVRPRGDAVRFYLDGRDVGTAAYRGAAARLPIRCRDAGVFTVSWAVLGGAGRVLRRSRPAEQSLLHVAEDAPVVAVDAEALLVAEAATAKYIRAIHARGWQVVCFDAEGGGRWAEVAAAMARQELPATAYLARLGEPELRAIDADHRRILLEAELHRARADGVWVCAVLLLDDTPLAGARDFVVLRVPRAPRRGERQVGALSAKDARDVEQLRDTLRASQRDAPSELAFRLDSVTHTRACDRNACRVELDNQRAREAVFDAIERAAHTVRLQFYIVEASDFVDHLAVRLVRKAREGVRVALLVDALYSRQGVLGAENPVLQQLGAEPGIEVRATKPLPTLGSVDLRSVKERDHRKIILIDERVAFVGGRNAGDPYYKGFDEVPITDFTSHERIPWLDAHVEVRGRLVAEIRRAFDEGWRESGGEALPEAPPPRARWVRNERCRLVLHDGVNDVYGRAAYEAMFDAARDRIYVVNAFPVFGLLRDALCRAARRGVQVTMLTGCALSRRADGSFFPGGLHRELFEYMMKQRLEEFLHEGVAIYEYATLPSKMNVARGGVVRPYVHAKVLVVDGEVASIGSANLDATASYWEREANVVIENGPLPAALEAELAAMCARSHRIDPSSPTWKHEAPQRELVARLWPTTLYS